RYEQHLSKHNSSVGRHSSASLLQRLGSMITALFILTLLAQPITDLGVITPSRAIVLEKCTNRTDFVQFVVEVQGMNKTEWSSNYVRFSTTNAILKIDDFAPILPGPAVMAVKSI